MNNLKSEIFYEEYKNAQLKNPLKERLEEPDPTAEMSDGSWEDLLRKWKLQSIVWVKQTSQQESAASSNDSLLPISLADSSTVAEIVETFSKYFIVKVVDKEIYAILHRER